MASRKAGQPVDPVAGAAALVVRVALAILLIGAPIASVATRQAVYALVPIGAALTLVGWLMDPDMRGPRRLQQALYTQAGLGVVFLACWAALSLLWTPFAVGPSERFVKSATTVGLVGVAIAFMPERTKTSNLYLLPIGASAGALALILAAAVGWNPPAPPLELTVLDRAALGLTLLFWPAVAGLLIREKQRLAVALAVLTVAALAAIGTRVAIAAIVVSAVVFFAGRNRPRETARWLSIGWGALLLLAPLLALALAMTVAPQTLPAAADPAIIWGQIVAADGFRTFIGHGFDAAARAMAAGYLPLSPSRSMMFELWFELGVVGVLAAIFIIARMVQLAGDAPRLVAPLLLAGLMSALVVSGFGVGISPIWWVTILALDGLAFALVLRGQFRGRRPSVRDIEGARVEPVRPRIPPRIQEP